MTEKNYNPEQRQVKATKKQTKATKKIAKAPVKESKRIVEEIEKTGVPKTVAEKEEKLDEKLQTDKPAEERKETPKTESKKEEKKPEKKKTYAVVNSYSVPVSTKQAVAVSRFIKRKSIENAMNDLKLVAAKKKAVPMKGEIPHRKGKMMSGRYPQKAAGQFIKILKSLAANANANNLNNPVVSEVISNMAQRPFGKNGRVRKKRSHIKIIAREAMEKKQ